ncbi:MAG: hypothetical protein CBB92_01140 [Flammeovirgaceae bacterium TMED32]|nr:MAG: hypothetical protein CBB92_00985 [Flammeovirgaceae bacterium TMED32]OUU03706.1 MAG: hypothetical protein CBB92_01140 [Flammeovirgaceae bacterium TMED32]
MPSSFYTVLSSALVFSTHPLVSVYGTVIKKVLFLEKINLHQNDLFNTKFKPFVTTFKTVYCFPSK